MMTIEQILEKIRKYHPAVQEDRLRLAFDYAEKAHRNSYRFSGDPWIHHLLAVLDILLLFKPDENTIIAAVLHDIMDTPFYDAAVLEKMFGDDVVSLLEVLSRLNQLQLRDFKADSETLRRMFLALAGDLRILLIRLADRIDNMRTLDFVQESKRRNIAYETLEIYVPIAARLGIYTLKQELEDLCFRYLYPQSYTDLQAQLDHYMSRQEKIIEHITVELKTFLDAHHVECHIEGRLKNLYSIFKKFKKKNANSLQEIFDIFAIRIILPDRYHEQGTELTDHLYAVLGLINSRWTPLLHRFKDYVALPKPNGYRSLHLAVLGLTPKPLKEPAEIQIRTRTMHEEADYGLAAHWLYKELPKDAHHENFPQYDWLSGLQRMQRSLHDNHELLQPFKVNIFQDRIFVLTPNGEVKDLPNGSTPIDFAYAIHTDVGHRCIGAKVNHAIVPLDYKLRNGEKVEILTQPLPDPKPHWLSLVKTSLARQKIRAYLKGADTQKIFSRGKELLNRVLEHLGYEKLDENLTLLKRYANHKLSLKDRVAIIEEIGHGTLQVGEVIGKVFGLHLSSKLFQFHELSSHPPKHLPKTSQKLASPSAPKKEPLVLIEGESNLPYKLSLCCKPVIGNPIVAYVGRGKSIRIHHQSCKLLKHVDASRTLEATWKSLEVLPQRYPVTLHLELIDRVGLIRDIADVIANFQLNILDLSPQKRVDQHIHRSLTVEVAHPEELEHLLKALRQIRNVVKVAPLSLPTSAINSG